MRTPRQSLMVQPSRLPRRGRARAEPHTRPVGRPGVIWARHESPQMAAWWPAKPPNFQQSLYPRSMSVGSRPTEEALRVTKANRRKDEKTSDVIRRALRLL